MSTYITNPAPLRAALELAKTRRVALCTISDSMGFWQNYGYQAGFQRALARRYGLYAIGPFPGSPYPSQNVYDGLAHGAIINQWSVNDAIFTTNTGAPAGFHELGPPNNLYGGGTIYHGTPHGYFYMPDGSAGISPGSANPQPTTNRGTAIVVDECLLPLSSGYTVWSTEGTFASGTAGVRYALHVKNSADVVLVNSNITPVTGADGIVDREVVVPSGSYAGQTHYIRYGRLDTGLGNQRWNGPCFIAWHGIEDHNATTGFHVAPMLWQGGLTSQDAVDHLTDADGDIASAGWDVEASSKEWLRQMTRLQAPDDPVLIVVFLHCTNDTTGGITAAGTADNAATVLATLRTWWDDLGHAESNLLFAPTIYNNTTGAVHTPAVRKAIKDAYDTEFAADSLVTPVWLGQFSGHELDASGMLDTSAKVHMEPVGYDRMSEMFVETVLGKSKSFPGVRRSVRRFVQHSPLTANHF